jgi:diaminohydroxyphosphoribosylaminopyrimidine deaminase/5-amino-6-(5-phosphoribosylamino)uracil reductase
LEAKGIRVEQIARADADGRPNFAAVVERLGKLEITSLVIEGGAQVNGTALASDAVDKVFLYFAPRILGEGAVPFTGSEGIGGKAKNLKQVKLHYFGEDFAVEGYLKDPYKD